MVKTSTRIVGALALAGALASGSAVSAAQPTPALDGDLSANRTSAVVKVPVDCDALPQGSMDTKSATVAVKLYQSVGRLLNIGTGSVASTPQQQICTGSENVIDVTVNAIPGLKFQPGPATILITLTETTTTAPVPPATTSMLDIDITESGARVNLRP